MKLFVCLPATVVERGPGRAWLAGSAGQPLHWKAVEAYMERSGPPFAGQRAFHWAGEARGPGRERKPCRNVKEDVRNFPTKGKSWVTRSGAQQMQSAQRRRSQPAFIMIMIMKLVSVCI
jgi:hypothetical protein